MDVLFVQAALQEHRLTAAPKKARKVLLTDPFIFHSIRSWLNPEQDPYHNQVQTLFNDPIRQGHLAEACAVAHYSRTYPTYYIKAEGEVDIAYIERGRFWPLEIKWTRQIRPKDLKQISKYPHSCIAAKYTTGTRSDLRISGIPAGPLAVNLLRLGPSPCIANRL